MLNFLNLLSARNWQNSSKLVFDRKYRKNFCHAKISCCWQCQKNAIVSPSSSLVLHRQSDHIINTDTHTWVENTFGKTRMMTEVPWSIFMVQNIEVWQFDQLVVCMQQYQLKCYDRFFLSTCLSDQFLLPIEFCHQSILLLIDFGNWFGNWFWWLILLLIDFWHWSINSFMGFVINGFLLYTYFQSIIIWHNRATK